MNTRERAERAERLLKDEVFQQAEAEARQVVLDEWITCQNAVEREALWHRYQALDGLPRQLRTFRDRGKFEEMQDK